MKHKAIIDRLMADLYEPWMNDEDKDEFNRMVFSGKNASLDDLDRAIETGIKNGYPAELQLQLIQKIITVMDKNRKG